MKLSSPRYCKRFLAFLTTIVVCAAIFWLGSVEAKLNKDTEALAQKSFTIPTDSPKVQAALQAQRLSSPQFLAQPEVVGTATGVDNFDEPTVLVFVKKAVTPGAIPGSYAGVPVQVKVTGEFRAMQASARYPRPVPIGVSVGNRFECSAGTIGARVKDADGRVYALSNNHVLALENNASIGDRVVQPGLFDTSCVFSRNNILGFLYDFEPISFSGSNIMDAAIARTNRKRLSRETPEDGYGRLKATTVAAVLGQQVQKYGRTTLLTRGTISGINGIFSVLYTDGAATFINQIVVSSTSAFILPGDSGSLLATYPSRNPVGLLFAGDDTGRTAIANPINPILQRFGMTIDGVQPR